MMMMQRKGNVQDSAAGAIVQHDGGTTLTGDATLIPRALYCKIGLEMNVKGNKMLLTRTATPAALCAIATEFTGHEYNFRSKASKQKAISDLETWIQTMKSAIPNIDERTKK